MQVVNTALRGKQALIIKITPIFGSAQLKARKVLNIQRTKSKLSSSVQQIVLGTCAAVLSFVTSISSAGIESIEQTVLPENFEKQSFTARSISRLLTSDHLRKIPLNDELSEKILDRYIDLLDPSKSFF